MPTETISHSSNLDVVAANATAVRVESSPHSMRPGRRGSNSMLQRRMSAQGLERQNSRVLDRSPRLIPDGSSTALSNRPAKLPADSSDRMTHILRGLQNGDVGIHKVGAQVAQSSRQPRRLTSAQAVPHASFLVMLYQSVSPRLHKEYTQTANQATLQDAHVMSLGSSTLNSPNCGGKRSRRGIPHPSWAVQLKM